MEIEIFTSLMMTHIFQSKQIEKPARRFFGVLQQKILYSGRRSPGVLKQNILYSGRRSPGVLKQNAILRAEVPRSFKTKILYSGRRSPGVLKQKYYTPGGGCPEVPRSFKTKYYTPGGCCPEVSRSFKILRAEVVRRSFGVFKQNIVLYSEVRHCSAHAPLILRAEHKYTKSSCPEVVRRWCGGNSVAITCLQGTSEELRVTPLHCVAIDFFYLRNELISSQSPTNLSGRSEVVRRLSGGPLAYWEATDFIDDE